jgi:hypothetical protein
MYRWLLLLYPASFRNEYGVAVGLTLAMTVAGSLRPALRAARIDPVAVIRLEYPRPGRDGSTWLKPNRDPHST